MTDPVFSVSQAVAVINQTFDNIYPTITVVGELSQFKIAKERWVYADLKDDSAKLKVFGTIYQLPGPMEDGMMVEVTAEPRLHPQFGFSLNIRNIRPVGEGSIKKATDLLAVKLEKEGLFSEDRKRSVPYGPNKVGLIASEQSAAYSDFIKILNARWQGVEVQLYNVTVQGESAPESIIEALNYFSGSVVPPEVLVMIRGGGSADDLAAFSTEQVTRAVASSRVPTVVAIGHESDTALAELAADMRASTPSNAAELLFPDKKDYLHRLNQNLKSLSSSVEYELNTRAEINKKSLEKLTDFAERYIENQKIKLENAKSILESVHPKATLKRGYAIVELGNKLVTSKKQASVGDELSITLNDGKLLTKVEEVQPRSELL